MSQTSVVGIYQTNFLSRTIHRILLSSVCLITPMLAMATEQPLIAEIRQIDIGTGSLDQVLAQFAGLSGVQLSYDPALVQGKISKGLKGQYHFEQGIAELLKGTGLTLVKRADGVWTIKDNKNQVRNMGQLKTIDVNTTGSSRTVGNDPNLIPLPLIVVNASDDAASEGKNTYKAKSSRSATKLDLTLKETPQSVSIVTRDQIEQRGLTDINEILQATPGVTVGKFRSEEINVFARGFSVSNKQVDGIPLYGSEPPSDSFFYDRVEVIKGASGLTGSTGNPSATINMLRKRPSKEFSGNVSASYGSWNNLRQEADVSIPFTQDGSIRSRVMAAHTDKESFMDYYKNKNIAAMAILEADLGENTTVAAGFQFQDNQPEGTTYSAIPYWYADGNLSNFPRSFSMAADWGTISQKNKIVFTDFQHRFKNDWLIKGIINQSKTDYFVTQFGSGGSPNPTTGTGLDLWTSISPYNEYKTTASDIYAAGPFNLLSRTHDLILGYANVEQKFSNKYVDVKTEYPSTIDYRIWNSHNLPKPTWEKNGNYLNLDTNMWSAYATLRLNLADPLKLILGTRYSDYERTTDHTWLSQPTTVTTDALTPYFGILYDINDQLTAYVSYTDMFTPSSNRDKTGKFLDPQLGENYELGLKASLFENKLLFSSALFQSKIKDVAVEDTTYNAARQAAIDSGQSKAEDFPVEAAYVSTGTGLKIEGIEIEAIGKINDNWNLTAGYTYVNSISSEIAKSAINIPQNQFKLYSNYTLPGTLFTGANRLTLGAGIHWQDDISLAPTSYKPANAVNHGLITQDSYYLLSASASYKFNDYFSATLNANNLLDKTYYQNLGPYGGYYGDPRNTVLTLRMKW